MTKINKTPDYILRAKKAYRERHKNRFICSYCSYLTHSSSNFQRHKKTKKCKWKRDADIGSLIKKLKL